MPTKREAAADGTVEFHYTGDGTLYVQGYPNDPYLTQTGTPEEVKNLIEQQPDLFALGAAPKAPKTEQVAAEAPEEVPQP